MKKQIKKTKTTKTKAKTLTQRIEALKALKVRRQKLTKRIEKVEGKLAAEVDQLRIEIVEVPKTIQSSSALLTGKCDDPSCHLCYG